jgi:hypothetical protein
MADLQTVSTSRSQLLVRTSSSAAGPRSAPSLSLDNQSLPLVPLCPNETATVTPGVSTPHRWYVADLGRTGLSTAELWELAHQAKRSAQLSADGAEGYVEPDLVQEWPYANVVRSRPGTLGAAPGDLCVFNGQDTALPRGSDFAWHLEDVYSQLATARGSVVGTSQPVRIGILDTGIDPGHMTRPKHLRLDLARNFVDDGRPPNDPTDPYERGLFNNPGHGTGTLGLLAGNLFNNPVISPFNDYIGGAPEAEIVPLRIATSVILFRTSAFATALDYLIAPNGNAADRADVVSMSMGGLASRAWADVVNRAYEAGLTIITAAGNNYPGTPASIVFPARFQRVIAACGVMADGRPYTRNNVPFPRMAGNYGPPSKMTTALSAYTPNTSWAEINCSNIVDMDGSGTSSATPQIAAAAALWLQKYKSALTTMAPWQVVEAVRSALFRSAKQPADPTYGAALGRGILQAAKALQVQPVASAQPTPPDSAAFALIRGLFGVPGLAPTPADMLELELTQVIQRDLPLSNRLADAERSGNALDDETKRWLIDRVVSQSDASPTLKAALTAAYPTRYLPPVSAGPGPVAVAKWPARVRKAAIPARRRLRGYAFDPQLSTEFETVAINAMTYDIPWESPLKAGPCGEYLEVVDFDPASGGYYQPVDLDDPNLLAQDGLTPSEGNPQFHQQMVYSVAMRTIENFEKALGRRVLWSPRMQAHDDSFYVPRLRIYPHAFRQRNAYYDPTRKALLFGYFPAADDDPGRIYPGGTVFTCLSHDIVAHETTHAILDGLNRGLLDPSNPDVLAFHEAFADCVALLQHFSFPGVLRNQIAKARGDLRSRNLLAELAVQFGEATGRYGALRSAIGRINPDTRAWEPLRPDPSELAQTREPHARGAILVAAIFDAFLTIYQRRTEDLLRIATRGTGVLPEGALHPDLVVRLADEAARAARHTLRMCVRAVDYCPPIDLTFGDYLRALITADAQLMPDDSLNYRIAFVDAFRRRGIYPKGLRSISVDTLIWDSPSEVIAKLLHNPIVALRAKGASLANVDAAAANARKLIFSRQREWRKAANAILKNCFIGLAAEDRASLSLETGLDMSPGYASFEVRSIQMAQKVGPDDNTAPQILISLVQERRVPLAANPGQSFVFRGGCVIVADPRSGIVEHVIQKNVRSQSRQASEEKFRMSARESLVGMYFGQSMSADSSRTFALLHGVDTENPHA